jgi:TPR repeat protein
MDGFAACENGVAAACLKLAESLLDARPKTSAVAMTWAGERACNLGLANGCAIAGAGYRYGGLGQPNLACAATWFERGCRGESTMACFVLGVQLYQGQGVVPDKPRAVTLLRGACSAGADLACASLEDIGEQPPRQDFSRDLSGDAGPGASGH